MFLSKALWLTSLQRVRASGSPADVCLSPLQQDDDAPKKPALYLMFDTSQESPVKSPPVQMSESPTPCSGYESCDNRATGQAGVPQPLSALELLS